MNTEIGFAWELSKMDGVAQADLVRRREVSPRELVQAGIDRINAGNDVVNAVVHRRFEQALDEADRTVAGPDAPFTGVPFLLKDWGATQAGVPQTLGNAALMRIGNTPKTDTPLGKRFRDSGFVTVGVTNVPELALLGDTQPRAFGPTRNPSCLDRSAGGSSGGAAAAVAAGLVPIAHGSDGAGSIRIPAAWCGIFGLKPSRGRMPVPLGSIDILPRSAEMVLTRTVRDAAAVLDAVNGALPGDLHALPRPKETYLESLQPPKRALRIGLLTEGPPNIPVDPACRRAVELTGLILREAGHHVEGSYPSALIATTPERIGRLGDWDGGTRMLLGLERLLGRPVEERDVEPYSWWCYQQRRTISAADYREYLGWHIARSVRLLQWWDQGFDLLVTPVTNALPDRLADLASESPAQMARTERRHVTFLEAFNVSGQPAIAFPALWTGDGVPVGVQIAAAKGMDGLLLQVAAQLEEAIGWPAHTPHIAEAARTGSGLRPDSP
ncbi:amidase [Pedococcus sp. P5_B7]